MCRRETGVKCSANTSRATVHLKPAGSNLCFARSGGDEVVLAWRLLVGFQPGYPRLPDFFSIFFLLHSKQRKASNVQPSAGWTVAGGRSESDYCYTTAVVLIPGQGCEEVLLTVAIWFIRGILSQNYKFCT